MDAQAILAEKRQEGQWDGAFLKGCMAMYRATGDSEYRDVALRFLNGAVSPDGEWKSSLPPIPFGMALLFGWDETKDERYKIAAGKLFAAADTCGAEPFIAAYDTRFGGKQTYKGIVARFQQSRRESFDEEKQLYFRCPDAAPRHESPLQTEGRTLLALVDTIEQMDMQIYEHFRTLADLFLEAAKGLLAWRKGKSGLLSGKITDPEGQPDPAGNVMAVYALLKGVRLGLLDEEKYLPIASQMAAKLKTEFGGGASDCPGLWLMMEAEMTEVENR